MNESEKRILGAAEQVSEPVDAGEQQDFEEEKGTARSLLRSDKEQHPKDSAVMDNKSE